MPASELRCPWSQRSRWLCQSSQARCFRCPLCGMAHPPGDPTKPVRSCGRLERPPAFFGVPAARRGLDPRVAWEPGTSLGCGAGTLSPCLTPWRSETLRLGKETACFGELVWSWPTHGALLSGSSPPHLGRAWLGPRGVEGGAWSRTFSGTEKRAVRVNLSSDYFAQEA